MKVRDLFENDWDNNSSASQVTRNDVIDHLNFKIRGIKNAIQQWKDQLPEYNAVDKANNTTYYTDSFTELIKEYENNLIKVQKELNDIKAGGPINSELNAEVLGMQKVKADSVVFTQLELLFNQIKRLIQSGKIKQVPRLTTNAVKFSRMDLTKHADYSIDTTEKNWRSNVVDTFLEPANINNVEKSKAELQKMSKKWSNLIKETGLDPSKRRE